MLEDLGLELTINGTPVDVIGTINTSIESRERYAHLDMGGGFLGSTEREVETKWAHEYRIHFEGGVTITGRLPESKLIHDADTSPFTYQAHERALVRAIVAHLGPVNWRATL